MNRDALQYISDDAIVGSGTEIAPFTYIDKDVVIGENCWIGPHVTILRGTRVGSNCKIFPGAVLGAIPQDLKFEGEDSLLLIGNEVTVREFCTLNRGTVASHQTVIEDQCLLMAYTHVAHDCIIRKGAVLANNVNLAGHVEIGPYSLLGGLVAVQQFRSIGAYAMVGGASLVRKNVPPFVRAAREPLSFIGINSIGLKRRGYNDESINTIKRIYQIIYGMQGSIGDRLIQVEEEVAASVERDEIMTFISNSKEGIIRSVQSQSDE